MKNSRYLKISLLAAGFCLFTISGHRLLAQELEPVRDGSNIDLSQITDAFTRNMKILDQYLMQSMHNAETHEMMQVVISKANDVARYYRSGGGAGKRRKLLEQQEALKTKKGFSKSDQAKLDALAEQISSLDEDNMFGKARSDMSQSVSELQRRLGLYQSSNTDVTNLIRLIQEHIQYYQNAVGKYQ